MACNSQTNKSDVKSEQETASDELEKPDFEEKAAYLTS